MKRNAKIWSLLIFISIGFFIPSDSYGDFTTDQNSFDFFVQTNDILFLNNFESEKNISSHYSVHLSEQITVDDLRNNQNNKSDVKNYSVLLLENISISDESEEYVIIFIPSNNFSFLTTLERIFEREKLME